MKFAPEQFEFRSRRQEAPEAIAKHRSAALRSRSGDGFAARLKNLKPLSSGVAAAALESRAPGRGLAIASSFNNGAFLRRLLLGIRGSRAALTLLEMMVAITLLMVIMVGLVMMFNQTQKALHIASQQSDVFEAARAAVQMISRDLAELSDFNPLSQKPRVTNCYAIGLPSPLPGGVLPTAGGPQSVLFGEAFWLTRANDDWNGVGYFVEGTNSGIGTLYRYFRTDRAPQVPYLSGGFYVFTNSRPIMEGVVHFSMSAVYIENQSGYLDAPVLELQHTNTFVFPYYYPEQKRTGTNTIPIITRISLPAFIDFELGVLEPSALKQFQSLTGNVPVTVSQKFLTNHVGQIHFFRERVPIRNFVNPYRSNEVP